MRGGARATQTASLRRGGRGRRGRRRLGPRRELVPRFGRQALVLLPLLTDVFLLFRRKFLERLVLLARGASLVGRELRPPLHLIADPLLLGRRHLGVAFRDAAPLGLALRVELVPVRRERCEHLLLGGVQLRPRRRARDRLRTDATRECRREQRRARRADQEPPSLASVFSQFWNPRSR